MDVNEFVAWATGYILFGIGEGRSLKELIHTIAVQAASNKVFGGSKHNNNNK